MLALHFSAEVRRAVRVDVASALLLAAFAGLTAPFTGLILRRDLGATPLQLAVMSSAAGASLLLSLAWARALKARAPLTCLVWTGIAARGMFLLVPLATSVWAFAGLVVAASLFGTGTQPAQAAVIERVYPRAQRGRALGVVRMAGAAAGVGLALGAGLLFERVDYRWIFPAAAVLGIASSLAQRRLVVPAPSAAEQATAAPSTLWEAWTAVCNDAPFRGLLTASFLFGLGCWIQAPAHPLLLVDVLRVTPAQVGLLAAAAALAALVGSGWWGWLVDRRGSVEALRTMYLVGAATPAIYAVAWSPWVLLLSSVTDSLMAVGLELVWMLALLDVAGPRRAAQYVAIGATLAGVRGLVGPLIGGLLIHGLGVRAVYATATCLMLGAVLLVGREIGLRVRARPVSPPA